MRHVKIEEALVRSLLNFVGKNCAVQKFSTTSPAFKRSKKPWPSGGSWEYAIADYKLRKEGDRLLCVSKLFLQTPTPSECIEKLIWGWRFG